MLIKKINRLKESLKSMILNNSPISEFIDKCDQLSELQFDVKMAFDDVFIEIHDSPHDLGPMNSRRGAYEVNMNLVHWAVFHGKPQYAAVMLMRGASFKGLTTEAHFLRHVFSKIGTAYIVNWPYEDTIFHIATREIHDKKTDVCKTLLHLLYLMEENVDSVLKIKNRWGHTYLSYNNGPHEHRSHVSQNEINTMIDEVKLIKSNLSHFRGNHENDLHYFNLLLDSISRVDFIAFIENLTVLKLKYSLTDPVTNKIKNELASYRQKKLVDHLVITYLADTDEINIRERQKVLSFFLNSLFQHGLIKSFQNMNDDESVYSIIVRSKSAELFKIACVHTKKTENINHNRSINRVFDALIENENDLKFFLNECVIRENNEVIQILYVTLYVKKIKAKQYKDVNDSIRGTIPNKFPDLMGSLDESHLLPKLFEYLINEVSINRVISSSEITLSQEDLELRNLFRFLSEKMHQYSCKFLKKYLLKSIHNDEPELARVLIIIIIQSSIVEEHINHENFEPFMRDIIPCLREKLRSNIVTKVNGFFRSTAENQVLDYAAWKSKLLENVELNSNDVHKLYDAFITQLFKCIENRQSTNIFNELEKNTPAICHSVIECFNRINFDTTNIQVKVDFEKIIPNINTNIDVKDNTLIYTPINLPHWGCIIC